jgi:hypothetical protein
LETPSASLLSWDPDLPLSLSSDPLLPPLLLSSLFLSNDPLLLLPILLSREPEVLKVEELLCRCLCLLPEPAVDDEVLKVEELLCRCLCLLPEPAVDDEGVFLKTEEEEEGGVCLGRR